MLEDYLNINNLMSILILALVFIAVCLHTLYSRYKNGIIAKDHILVEIWPQTGQIREEMYPYKQKEIYYDKKASKFLKENNIRELETVPRYFVDNDAVGTTFWPSKKGLGILSSVQVPKVIIWEDDPEPMSRRRIQVFTTKMNEETGEMERVITWVNKSVPIGTPATMGLYKDESYSLFSASYEREIDELKMKLLKGLANRISATVVYVAIFASLAVAGLALYLINNIGNDIAELKAGAGL